MHGEEGRKRARINGVNQQTAVGAMASTLGFQGHPLGIDVTQQGCCVSVKLAQIHYIPLLRVTVLAV
jgi:hypothetical protein